MRDKTKLQKLEELGLIGAIKNMGCDRCGLDDVECRCYLHDLEDRITIIEESIIYICRSINKIENKLLDYEKKDKEDS